MIFTKNETTGKMEERLSLAESAEYLGVSYAYLRVASADSSDDKYGAFPQGHKIHRSRHFTREELDSWWNGERRHRHRRRQPGVFTIAEVLKDCPQGCLFMGDRRVKSIKDSTVPGKALVEFEAGGIEAVSNNRRLKVQTESEPA